MNRGRLDSLLSELMLPATGERAAEIGRPGSLQTFVSGVLGKLLFTESDLERTDSALSKPWPRSLENLGLGVGFASWIILEASDAAKEAALNTSTEAIIHSAGKWADFLLKNFGNPMETWGDIADLAKNFAEHALTLPAGTLELTADVLVAMEHSGDFWENLEIVGAAGDVADFLDGVTTLGLGILASWTVGKIADWVFDSVHEEQRERLRTLRVQLLELGRLHHALLLGIPAPVIAPHLDKIASAHWGF